jgi:hypothetical protein
MALLFQRIAVDIGDTMTDDRLFGENGDDPSPTVPAALVARLEHIADRLALAVQAVLNALEDEIEIDGDTIEYELDDGIEALLDLARWREERAGQMALPL